MARWRRCNWLITALANIGILIGTLISAVALAISTIAGVLDRRRVLGPLRLTGMSSATLRRMLVAEAAIPIAGAMDITYGPDQQVTSETLPGGVTRTTWV